jgi:Ca-activated chloride channel family protein
MPAFEYSRWDGSQQFLPQSADKAFDQISEYLLQYGADALPLFDELQQQSPELLDQLIQRGYVEQDAEGNYRVTPQGVRRVESKALDELFDITRKDRVGRHDTDHKGTGQIVHEESKPYEFGDPVAHLNLHETLRNALIRTAPERQPGSAVRIGEEDLVIHETEYQTNCATVVLLDMSGSMTRYGKYGQAKKVALALLQLVRGRYPGDFLEVVGFYTYASPLTERELFLSAPKPVSIYDSRVHMRVNLDQPPAFIPEHFTNIHAGLQFARRILRRQPAANKQIIVITDGEPTAHLEGRDLVLIYPPAEKTARATLAEARACANEGLHISSFALVEDYFYLGLVNFVEQMAAASGGISAYCNADDLGNLVIESFNKGRKRRRVMR